MGAEFLDSELGVLPFALAPACLIFTLLFQTAGLRHVCVRTIGHPTCALRSPSAGRARPFAPFLSINQLIQILAIHLEPFAKSSLRKLALPNELPDGPKRTAKIVCGFG
jgi:hypothetical protein